MEDATYGVSELAGLIGRVLAQVFPGSIWVRGQIRNLSRSANGHVYFDLAEPGPLGTPPSALVPVTLLAAEKAQVNSVMKGSGAGRMEDGAEVRIAGRLNWFTPRGRLQLRMTGVDPSYTLGRLLEDRDRLLATLKAEGLLTRNQALPLPLMPLRVGVVTSLGQAAHADFLHELERSGLGFHLVEVDARTQGLDAGRLMADGISALERARVDVIAVVRGGGSRTDLAPFDGEVIARAIASCRVPVFTGIGHEIDRSIADEVAHTAHKTPTACAAALVAHVAAGIARTEEVWASISRAVESRMARVDDRLLDASWRLVRSTSGGLASADRNLDDARRRLQRDAIRALSVASERLDGVEVRVKALDPALNLARGWSITRDSAGRVVQSVEAVAPGDTLVTTLAEGALVSTVSGEHEPGEHETGEQET